MTWKRRKKNSLGINKNYSLIQKLKKENKYSTELEVLINSLTLEEIIGTKLELASKAAGGNLYGLPLWFSIQDIIKESIFKFAVSATKTKGEASRFLGVTPSYFRQLYKKFDIDNYFNDGGEMDSTG